MALGILNNIPSLAAENQLTLTNSALQSTLAQLSSGSRINTGADDAAGLAIANGLQANITALTQSVSNANNGVGELQLADGALAQVTNLLNRAITLATESATGTVSDPQRTALQAEYASILAEIDRIGSSTTYNGQAVFHSGSAPNLNAQDSPAAAGTLSLGTVLTPGDTTTVSAGGQTFTYTAGTTSGANPNEITGAGTGLTAATAVAAGDVLTLTRGTGTSTYTATAATNVGALLTAINTGTSGGSITVGGTDASHAGYQAVLAGGNLQVTDLNGNGDLAATEANTNVVTSASATVTGATALAATDVFTITRGTGATTYTVGAGGSNITELITAITTGASTANITVSGAGDTNGAAQYGAAIVGGHLQITDLSGTGIVTGAASTGLTTGADFTTAFADLTNSTLGGFTTNAAATSTVQDLINAINADTTVGAKAALVSGTLEVTDPLNRGDINVSTTDTVLGAPVSGAPTDFTTPTTTGTTTTNPNELVSSGGASTPLTASTALTNGAVTSFTAGGKTFTFTAGAASTVGDLISAISNPSTDAAGLQAYISSGELVVVDPKSSGNLAVNSTTTETVLGAFSNPSQTGSTITNIFLSDSTGIGSSQIGVTIGALATSGITNGTGGNAVDLAVTDLSSQTDAQTALTQINAAIANIASVRGTLGASVNRLTAASNVLNSQVQNLTSAENTITAADIPTAVANLTKYSILEQTGIAALAQANQQQQIVLKLLQ
ncbi:MAG TPA: flagellin [Terriglobales bacterium]|nr:flagellin [Terriglobales bacterium]